MSTSDYELALPPEDERKRELWLQNAAGFILFEDARRYALDRIDPHLGDSAKEAARKAIDDALYGFMMVADGVTGALRNRECTVHVQVDVRLIRRTDNAVIATMALNAGDGMCMGYHAWRENDFGSMPIATPRR